MAIRQQAEGMAQWMKGLSEEKVDLRYASLLILFFA